MAGLIDSYKKVYENKTIHLWMFLIALVWSVLSNLCDIAMGRPDTFRQNPFDLIFNFLVGIYSIQFLHNAILSDFPLLSFNEINWKALPGLIGLNIVWGMYAGIILLAALISFVFLHSWVVPIIMMIGVVIVSVFVYYVFLAYAEDFQTKGLLNIKLLLTFIKVSAKETYKNLLVFLLFNGLFIAVYLMIYVAAGYFDFDKFGHIAGDYYTFDLLMYAGIGYFLIISWYFAFPYSLIKTYIEKIRPVIKKEQGND